MKRNLANIKTALVCTSFILLTGMGSVLFLGGKNEPRSVQHMADGGLEILALNTAMPLQSLQR